MPYAAKGKSSSASRVGMLFGLLSFFILNIYAATTLGTFFFSDRKANISSSVKQQHFTSEDTFGTNNSLSLAFGLDGVPADYLKDGLLRPDVGELRMSIYEWYENDTTTTIPINTHPCTAEELGLTESQREIIGS